MSEAQRYLDLLTLNFNKAIKELPDLMDSCINVFEGCTASIGYEGFELLEVFDNGTNLIKSDDIMNDMFFVPVSKGHILVEKSRQLEEKSYRASVGFCYGGRTIIEEGEFKIKENE